MRVEAYSRCYWGMLEVNNASHSYLDIMMLENSGRMGEYLFFIFVNFKLHNKQNWQTQCLYRLVIPDVNKNDFIQGAGWLGKNDVTWEQANSTSVLPDQKTKQS
jgi:hypothetical protein